MAEKTDYKNITTQEQFREYRSKLKDLLDNGDMVEDYDEIQRLTFFMDTWKQEQGSFEGLNPIEYLRSSMLMHNLKAKHMVEILGISKELMSDILNYKRGLSTANIKILATRFGVSEEAFSRPYKLRAPKKGTPRTVPIITHHK